MAKTATAWTCLGMSVACLLLANSLTSQAQKADKPAAGKEVLTYYDPKRDKLIGGTVTSVAFSHDGKRVAAADVSPTVKIWDASTSKPLVVLFGPAIGGVSSLAPYKGVLGQLAGAAESIAFSPDGKHLAGGGSGKERGGEVRVWDAATGKTLL